MKLLMVQNDYDEVNRIKWILDQSGTNVKYTFDGAGNRETEILTDTTGTYYTTYTYNDQNRMQTIEKRKDNATTGQLQFSASYGYDSNGNQQSITQNQYQNGNLQSTTTTGYVYDNLNRLAQTGTNIYNYNGDGLRVEKIANGTLTTRYIYEYDNVVLELDSNGDKIAKNVYGTNLLARTVYDAQNTSGTSMYYMYNGHGDVTALLDINGDIAGSYYYDAFGKILESGGTMKDKNPIRYAGYQWDEESGLYYLNARMYDPTTARFLQEDTYSGDADDPLSLNLYTYCANNPLMYWDPTGHYYQKQYVAGYGIKEVWVNDPVTINVNGIQIQGEYSEGRIVASKNALNKELLGIPDSQEFPNLFGSPGTNVVYFEDSKVVVNEYLADLGISKDTIRPYNKDGKFYLYAGTGSIYSNNQNSSKSTNNSVSQGSGESYLNDAIQGFKASAIDNKVNFITDFANDPINTYKDTWTHWASRNVGPQSWYFKAKDFYDNFINVDNHTRVKNVSGEVEQVLEAVLLPKLITKALNP
jgi:RHS repeat-associated protein